MQIADAQLSDQDKQAKVRILLWVIIGTAAESEHLTTFSTVG